MSDYWISISSLFSLFQQATVPRREMVKKRHRPLIRAKEVVSLINQVIYDRPLVPFLIPLFLFAWALERWLVPFSNWVPLAASVWATILVSCLFFIYLDIVLNSFSIFVYCHNGLRLHWSICLSKKLMRNIDYSFCMKLKGINWSFLCNCFTSMGSFSGRS